MIRTRTTSTAIFSAFIAALTLSTTSARAVPPSIIRAIDRDAVVVYFGHARNSVEAKEGEGVDSLMMASAFIDNLDRMGLLAKVDSSVRYWIDSLTALNDIKENPHAIVLYNIDATPRDDGGHQLAKMQAAIIIHTDGHNKRIEKRIQHLLNHYTNNEEASLVSVKIDGETAYMLKNKQLPKWAIINWGAIGPYYVISIGKGVYRRTLDAIKQPARSLMADPWFGRAYSSTQGSDALVGWFMRFDMLQLNADPLLLKKIQRTMESLSVQTVQRGLWMVRKDLRAIHITGYINEQGKDHLQKYTNSDLIQSFKQQLIPHEATHYAVIDGNPHGLLVGLDQAFQASRSPSAQASHNEFWKKVEEGANLSLEKDLYAHLDRPIIIHDWPKHAFHLPLAWTILIKIKDDPDALRTRVDHLFDYISKEMLQDGLIKLRRDDDGLWYIYAGIMGPAIKVTDEWVVISFSPVAVRQNIALWNNNISEPRP